MTILRATVFVRVWWVTQLHDETGQAVAAVAVVGRAVVPLLPVAGNLVGLSECSDKCHDTENGEGYHL